MRVLSAESVNGPGRASRTEPIRIRGPSDAFTLPEFVRFEEWRTPLAGSTILRPLPQGLAQFGDQPGIRRVVGQVFRLVRVVFQVVEKRPFRRIDDPVERDADAGADREAAAAAGRGGRRRRRQCGVTLYDYRASRQISVNASGGVLPDDPEIE